MAAERGGPLRPGRSLRAGTGAGELPQRVLSLEAHVGYMEAALQQGEAPEALLLAYQTRIAPRPGDPVRAFAEAYLVARRLPSVADPEQHAAEVARARALLRPASVALPRNPEVHHLYGYLAHRHYHRTGDKASAMAAHTRYHLALDLSADDPRRRASLLDELGLLQASLGNHRIALRHLLERERLPFITPEEELAFRLAKARSLFQSPPTPMPRRRRRGAWRWWRSARAWPTTRRWSSSGPPSTTTPRG